MTRFNGRVALITGGASGDCSGTQVGSAVPRLRALARLQEGVQA